MKGMGWRERVLAALGVAVLFLGGWGVLKRWRREVVDGGLPQAPERAVARPPGGGKPGDAILRGYGRPEGTVEGDLRMVAEAMGNLALLVKGEDPLPLGANEELAAALRGKNRARLEFVSAESPVFNGRGQVADRWGTALFFHAKAGDRVDIRSAGPDRMMWTADDTHRVHDGRFLRGEELMAPSLDEAGR